MDKSPLNKLSAELRNNIYEYAVTENEPLQVQSLSGSANTAYPAAILDVCQHMRLECEAMFYASNTFAVSAEPTQTRRAIQKFYRDIRPTNAMVVRSISVDIGTLYGRDKLDQLCQAIQDLRWSMGLWCVDLQLVVRLCSAEGRAVVG